MTEQANGAAPQVVQPAPLNESWSIAQQTGDDGVTRIVVQIFHVAGVHVSFMTPEAAKTIAANFERVASQAQTGLILPPGFPR